uniref:glycoside hydrolase family 2 protein n=1 Tax=uncultured Draconibacterium sp. TaxID=1573823 RepID=UPI00321648F2
MKRLKRNNVVYLLLWMFIVSCSSSLDKMRQEISLNGTWKITKTSVNSDIPTVFESQIPVPGLVDMAVPAMEKQDTLYENTTYWYRTKFKLDHSKSEKVKLKINKAKYFSKVYLNNRLIGENSYSFTPSVFDIKQELNAAGEENELIIAVGCQNTLPDTVANGHDFEKTKYIPGIYDDVTLVLSNDPHIKNVQVVPDIEKEEIRIVSEIETDYPDRKIESAFVIRELVSGKVVVKGTNSDLELKDGKSLDFKVSIPDCKLWSPENPFLYELELSTQGDRVKVRFGMRHFYFDESKGCAILNGKPYYMRGTNVCIFRFFEDPDRNGLPWDRKWVVRLHEKFKEMNWNSIRYCIGFPPEEWYHIADSLGFLIQDEFPIWTIHKRYKKLPQGLTADRLSVEFNQWMRERWNHPCVVIWDAQNESVTEVTGEAIHKVRRNDLSNRPWDNGWAAPDSEADCIETHPYLFQQYFEGADPSADGPLKDLLTDVRIPFNGPNKISPKPDGGRYNNPIVINEYAWIWLNRDGSPTTLTDRIYDVIFAEADTPEKRYKTYSKHLGILTEYWRVHRKCAALMHFCGLGYSRPDPPRGQTSDNFIDIAELVYEPHFYKYVKPAFNPVGLMIDVWDKKFAPGCSIDVPVHIINDTYEKWSGAVVLSVLEREKIVHKQDILCELDGLGKEVYKEKIMLPPEKGKYKLVAEINYKGEFVKSIRDIEIK